MQQFILDEPENQIQTITLIQQNSQETENPFETVKLSNKNPKLIGKFACQENERQKKTSAVLCVCYLKTPLIH